MSAGPDSGNTGDAVIAVSDDAAARRGTVYGVAAYGLWGAMPLYFLALTPASAWEILAHRIGWSLVVCLVLLAIRREFRSLLSYLRVPRQLGGVAVAGMLIAVNWTVYLIAVQSAHVTEAALGYFLNPLVSVALGLLVLRERLRRGQAIALGIGALGGFCVALDAGTVPWVALGLAFSFGMYGLTKKRLGVRLSAVASLSAETAVLAPLAVLTLLVLGSRGLLTFTSHGPLHAALMVSTGVVTAVPLLLFAAAARRVTLVMIGLLQFIAPILQFLAGLLLGETMSTGRWVGFSIVWVALLVLVADGVLASVGRRQAYRAAGGTPAARA